MARIVAVKVLVEDSVCDALGLIEGWHVGKAVTVAGNT